ncbi:WD40-like Beta Propeller Repeat [Flavobacterium aquidurense]|uniref:Flagellar motor protein MotB n=1 Tax=Flavobacterium frigidimaris TaxID=262320 RepID=A0ABX4BRB5_FLAFR|nr:OmpA family protein [Flavobacterium frigidimaris]OXA79705.1 flagellar motor protein MotB [Flavobacterium frigidimaris]SDZ16801.1 WD40-like Beta Propeller Repeat [Flavobacterium aquidurense]
MRIKNLSYTVLFLCFFIKINAQTTSTKFADKQYDDYAYADAIKAYENIVNKGKTDEKIVQRLGNCYYFIGELQEALKWFDELFRMNEKQEAEYLYRYAQCLKSDGNYRKADEILEKFNQNAVLEKRAALSRNDKNYLEEIKSNSGRFEIADAGINSPYSDYGSVVYDNKIVFTSARDTGGIGKNNFKWTNKSFSKLYKAEMMPDGAVGKPKLFQKKENAKFNESTPVFTKDGRTMYFTRNNFIDGKRGKSEKQITLLKLYKAELINDEWENIKELPFNSDQYSTAHPTLSNDEKYLYFASDMPGTLGQSDLYKVKINEDGTFEKPENLGSSINTEGRETFPFISGDNELYFASDGRPGLGGLDVFVTKINDDGIFEEIQNVGEPINSKQDDFGFTIDSKNRIGFFSSNREAGHGLDDIYRFRETRKLVCEQDLIGYVNDAESNEMLSNAALTLFDENFIAIKTISSDEKGNYIFAKIKCGKKYTIRASKNDYGIKEIPVAIKRANGTTTVVIPMDKMFKPMTAKAIEVKKVSVSPVKIGAIKVGTDLAKLLHIPMNFFDLGKATIKKTSEPQLQKIVDMLNQYPAIKLDIRSHTDSRQSDANNMILSEKRAQSTKNWLVQKGIDESRLTAKGYGETKLVNQCADGVKCTEKQHEQNRRSEFIITNL